MAVPSSDRAARRPFLLSLSLFLLISALLVLVFIFLDPSPGSLAFLPSRLSGSAPSFPPPLLPQQQSTATIPTPESPPHSQSAAPVDDAASAKAEEDTAGAQSDATAGVESSGNRDPSQADNNGGAPDGTAGAGVVAEGDDDDEEAPVQVRWETCRVGRGVSAADYIPCLDNVRAIKALRSRRHMEHRERHCPVPRPRCLVPLPAGYRTPVPWPQSRDMIWYNNVPHPKLVEYKKDQKWVTRSGDYLVFPGGGTQFKDGVGRYVQFIEQIMPSIQWGSQTRTVLDVGCGVASFGGYLLDRNVITMSLAPKDEHEAQIQFALERGIPAFLAVIATQKLPFPDNAFDVVHCASDGCSYQINVLENCGQISRCEWYTPLDSCLLASPVSNSDDKNNWPVPWPERLNVRYTGVPDDSTSNKEKFDADTMYWKQIVSEVYINDVPLNWSSIRNVMDMNAGFGGCDIIEVAAEIDRILRPGRWFVLKDTMGMIKKMRPVLKSLHYETVIVKQQYLVATKSFWRPGKSVLSSDRG
ncbi:hypothetical protein PR202_gb01542 [Eleusine coracana subsp. coracana]|uniref:Methyltransferase n=1 Tax=Eleusine coracana subsp. coracana TaxID=191504 RepID=A0AAV5DW48_ELECO|nr:hypothetical protein PR202_gb01542 [Eleusine coracana subsp. coracana]